MIRLLFHPIVLIALVALVAFTPLSNYTPMAGWTTKMAANCSKIAMQMQTATTGAEYSLPQKVKIPAFVTSAISSFFGSAATFCANPKSVIPEFTNSSFLENSGPRST